MSAANAHLVGLVGSGIQPSLTPPLHEREADELGIRYVYRRLDLDSLDVSPEDIGTILTAARLTGYDGINVTHPCKQLVLEHVDELSPDAAALNAVNTVVFRDGRAVGHNTDWSGFARSLSVGLPDATTDHVLVLGAGGAGSAVAHALLTVGAGTVRVLDVDTSRADALATALCAHFGAGRATTADLSDPARLADSVAAANGLVHATPTGMAAHPGLPLPAELLRPDLWVAEVVYRPLRTELVSLAQDRGCRVLDGGRMAVYQAADSFALFTGVEPDTDRMLRHFATLTPHTSPERTHPHVPG